MFTVYKYNLLSFYVCNIIILPVSQIKSVSKVKNIIIPTCWYPLIFEEKKIRDLILDIV